MATIFSDTFTGALDPGWTGFGSNPLGLAPVNFTGNKLNIVPDTSLHNYFLYKRLTSYIVDDWVEKRFDFSLSRTTGYITNQHWGVSDIGWFPATAGVGMTFSQLFLRADSNGDMRFGHFWIRPDLVQDTTHDQLTDPLVANQVYDIQQRVRVSSSKISCYRILVDGEEIISGNINFTDMSSFIDGVNTFFTGYYSLSGAITSPPTTYIDNFVFSNDPTDTRRCNYIDLSKVRFRASQEMGMIPPRILRWTLRTSDADGIFPNHAISIWSETLGKFIVNDDDIIEALHSDDAITWISDGNPFSPSDAFGLYGKIALDDSEPRIIVPAEDGIYTSVDGTNYSSLPSIFDSSPQSPAGVGYSSTLDRWVVLGDGGVPGFMGIYSDDAGASWNNSTHAIPDLSSFVGGQLYFPSFAPHLTNLISVAGNVITMDANATASGTFSTFVLGVGGGTNPFTATLGSPDIIWHPFQLMTGVAWSPTLNIFVVSGTGGNPGYPCFWTSSDGLEYTQQVSPFDGSGWIHDVIWSSILNKFIGVGRDSLNTKSILSSNDGITWDTVVSDPFPNGEGQSVVEAFGKIFVSGFITGDTPTVFSTSDLITWVDEECPIDGNVYSLSYSPSLQRLVAFGVPFGASPEFIATLDYG